MIEIFLFITNLRFIAFISVLFQQNIIRSGLARSDTGQCAVVPDLCQWHVIEDNYEEKNDKTFEI